MSSLAPLADREILAARPPKRRVDPHLPQGFFVEPEPDAGGRVVHVATILLTNRECPFRCLVCDLWKGTTDEAVPPGAIPAQIDYALARLPGAGAVKLYNAGNFFDARAIPPEDHEAIAARVCGFETVIVENHPRLAGPECAGFAARLHGRLEVAMGLETVHPDVLPALNKQMTLDDFARAVDRLLDAGLSVRAFVLIRPPYLDEREGVEWAVRSLEYAFSIGVGCCSVIPVRGGNGALERLACQGHVAPPTLASIEAVQDAGVRLGRGRVFVDLWDLGRFASCPRCVTARRERLHRINLEQHPLPEVRCSCATG